MSDTKITTHAISSGSILRIILILVLFYGLFIIKNIILTLLTAIIIASAIEPGAAWLEKRKIPRTIAVLMIYVAVFLFFGGLFAFFMPMLFKEVVNMLNVLPEYIDTIIQSSTSKGFEGIAPLFSESTFGDILKSAGGIFSGATLSFVTVASSLFGGLLGLLMTVVISFYLAVQKNGVTNFLSIIVPNKHEEYAIDLWKRSQKKIGLWMQGQLLLAILVGVLTYLLLSILGIPNALVLALITAVFELIPVIGPILAAVPAIAFAFVDGGATSAVLVAGVYVVIQQLENNLFHPLVVKKIVGIPSLVAIIALIVGAQLAGFLGIVIAVPMAAALMEFLHDVEKNKAARRIKNS
jgi:predicted PurR-regulated permease PerM